MGVSVEASPPRAYSKTRGEYPVSPIASHFPSSLKATQLMVFILSRAVHVCDPPSSYSLATEVSDPRDRFGAKIEVRRREGVDDTASAL